MIDVLKFLANSLTTYFCIRANPNIIKNKEILSFFFFSHFY